MKFKPTLQNTVLLCIDVQGNLSARMHNYAVLYRNLSLCIQAAHILDIPIIATEQVPGKLGQTYPPIQVLLGKSPVISKNTFSCLATEEIRSRLRSLNRDNVIVMGIEAHVCVYQTVFDLLKENYIVHVVTDAVSSRIIENKILALNRMENMGACLTGSEMLFCELLGSAQHPKFREILKLIK